MYTLVLVVDVDLNKKESWSIGILESVDRFRAACLPVPRCLLLSWTDAAVQLIQH